MDELNFTTKNALLHYGVKGMKWGVITSEYEPVGRKFISRFNDDVQNINKRAYNDISNFNRRIRNDVKSINKRVYNDISNFKSGIRNLNGKQTTANKKQNVSSINSVSKSSNSKITGKTAYQTESSKKQEVKNTTETQNKKVEQAKKPNQSQTSETNKPETIQVSEVKPENTQEQVQEQTHVQEKPEENDVISFEYTEDEIKMKEYMEKLDNSRKEIDKFWTAFEYLDDSPDEQVLKFINKYEEKFKGLANDFIALANQRINEKNSELGYKKYQPINEIKQFKTIQDVDKFKHIYDGLNNYLEDILNVDYRNVYENGRQKNVTGKGKDIKKREALNTDEPSQDMYNPNPNIKKGGKSKK